MNRSSLDWDLAITVLSKIRENWASRGTCIVTKTEIKEKLLERLRIKYDLQETVSWLNYSQYALIDVKQKMEEADRNLESNLASLSKAKFICPNDDAFVATINFQKLLEKLLSRECLPVETARVEIEGFFSGSPEDMLNFLSFAGLIKRENNNVKSTLADRQTKDAILDEALTFIEQKDSLQIRYGLYDTSMSGIDFFTGKKSSDDPLLIKTEYGLRTLMDEKFLLPLNLDEDILKWEFRSRIAEITRLLTKLRQRFNEHTSYRSSPRLTRSVKLEIMDRKFPIKAIDVSNCIRNMGEQLRASSSWSLYSHGWNNLSSILASSLKERDFGKLSDFQDRCFKKIFVHLVDPQSRLKGFVISAGTGMGKTLSYIGPLMLYLLLEKSEKHTIGTKAICIYPRIKLAENQIEGFIKTIYRTNQRLDQGQAKITVGIDYSGTPYRRNSFASEPLKDKLYEGTTNRLWEYDAESNAYICPYARCPECNKPLYIERKSDFSEPVPLKCLDPKCNTQVDFVGYCKDDIAKNPPDILIITTESLTLRLNGTKYQSVFGDEQFCKPKLVMIDEIHMHTSIKGSQVAFLIRRLLQRISLGSEVSQQVLGEPIVLGLSATIGQPEEFFSDLTGIPKHFVEVEGPREDELEKSGVEYFLFVKPEISQNIAVISNLIQTCMCVLHNAIQHRNYPHDSNKALGFVDSLDSVKRWSHDLKDAEKLRLYRLRDPEKITSDTAVRDYFGPTTADCVHCSRMVNKTCVHFQEGECWWFMRYGNSQTDPLDIHFKTSGEGNVPAKYDLVVTTSAMEVGYDDPDITCIVQYQSPINAASFTQRKGRAGRSVRDRPISVAVLSPYRTKDVYTYRNHHMLIEPSFERLPLNVDNKSVRRIHGFYALLDLLAFQKRGNGTSFDEYMGEDDLEDLRSFSRRNRTAERYLKQLFNYTVNDKEIEEIWSLFRELMSRIETSSKDQLVSRILSDYLPANLFSSINLPTVNVYEYNVYSGKEQWNKSWRIGCSLNPNTPEGFLKILEKGYCPDSGYKCAKNRNCKVRGLEKNLDINLALSEASIANVTYRWGSTAYWIPPYNNIEQSDGSLKQMDIRNNWIVSTKQQNRNINRIAAKNIPKTLKEMVPSINNGLQEYLPIIRPDIIREAKFLSPENEESHWIYCFDDDNVYAGANHYQRFHKEPEKQNHRYDTISARTTSYPFSFYHIDFNQNALLKGRNGIIKSGDIDSDFERGRLFGIYDRLFHEMYFANKDTGEYLRVNKVVVGSTCSIITRRDKVERVFGYVDNDQDVSLGYNMETDGIDIWIRPQSLKPESVEKEFPGIFNTLKHNFFKFEVLKENKKPGGRNSYSVDAFLNVYLTVLADKKTTITEIVQYQNNGCTNKDIQNKFKAVMESYFTYNSRTKKSVLLLLEDETFFQTIIEKHKEILEEKNKKIIYDYIEDTFHHSLKHALKSAFIVLGGFESERDVGGWTYLNFDSDFQKHIYVFENGMYGTGVFRSIHGKFAENPQKLWNIVEEYMVSCTTSDEEDFLKRILELDDPHLQRIDEKLEKIFSNAKFVYRRNAINDLVRTFRKEYLFELRDEDVKALNRVFARPLELQGTLIENWKLFKELNITFYNHYKNFYDRDLTSEEIQELFFTILKNNEKEINIPTWKSFFETLKSKGTTGYGLFLKKIQYDLERIKGLKDLLSRVNLSDLKRIHGLAEEEQLVEISKITTYDSTSRKNKKIADTLFVELDDIPMFIYYYNFNSRNFPEDDLRTSLSKQSLREEIEKRLLNTCIDACPTCLQTKCELDFDLRSKLLLSRRLLKYAVSKLKDKYTIYANENLGYDQLKSHVLNKLEETYQAIIKYPLSKSTDVAMLVSELLGQKIIKNNKQYLVMVNSSGISDISFKDRTISYELNLRCREVQP